MNEILDTIKEKLKCPICLEFATEPRIMACCGNIGCASCISKWHETKANCPFCNMHSSLDKQPPISVPVISQMTDLVKKNSWKLRHVHCKYHKVVCTHFCETCDQSLCPNCLFDELFLKKKHEKHKIIEIEEHYKNQAKDVVEIVPNLLENIENIEEKIKEMRRVVFQEENKKSNLIIDLYSQLESLITDYKRIMNENSRIIDKQVHDFEQTKKEISEVIKKKTSSICKDLEFFFKSTNFNIHIPKPAINPLILPKYEFLILFPTRLNNDFAFSKKFICLQSVWRLKYYPKGMPPNINYISLFLELNHSNIESPMSIFYKIELIGNNPSSDSFKKQATSIFEEKDVWGWSRFIDMTKHENANEYVSNDQYRVRLTIEPKLPLCKQMFSILDV